MPTVRRSTLIRGDRAALFALTQDYGRRLAWDPFLKEARLLGGATGPAVGVRAWCVARSGLGMETEYVSYAPPSLAAVRMTRGPRCFESFAGSWRFDAAGLGLTRVTFAYHLEARPRFLRPLLDPILLAVCARDARRRLAALRRVAEGRDQACGAAGTAREARQ